MNHAPSEILLLKVYELAEMQQKQSALHANVYLQVGLAFLFDLQSDVLHHGDEDYYHRQRYTLRYQVISSASLKA